MIAGGLLRDRIPETAWDRLAFPYRVLRLSGEPADEFLPMLVAGPGVLGGKTVSVAGPGGRTYYYEHLDDYAKGLRTAQQVTTGTVLGFVGDTGSARGTPPHLHFGVYGRGGALDPFGMLAGSGGSPHSSMSEREADADSALHRVVQPAGS